MWATDFIKRYFGAGTAERRQEERRRLYERRGALRWDPRANERERRRRGNRRSS